MTDSSELDELIKRGIAATSTEEKLAIYRDWAKRYDKDLAGKGYVAPATSVEKLKAHLPALDSAIYDAGCGTGQVGTLLSQLGYGNITGADFSEDMLSVARMSDSYAQLLNADYTQPIVHDTNSFDAAICVGVYSPEFKDVFLPELIRTVKPGGIIVYTCRPVHFDAVAKLELEELLAEGSVSQLARTLEPYMTSDNADAWYVVLEVSAAA